MSPRRLVPLLLFFAVLAFGCARPRTGPGGGASDAGVAIDPSVMAFLSMARAAHHEANLREQSDDVPGAIAALEALTRARRPHPGEVVPEIDEVLADTFARVAELQVRRGDLDPALGNIRQGLTHATAPSYFRGHLLEVEGIAEEARAAALRDAGKFDEAVKARAHALELLHQAIAVQEQVIAGALAPDAASGQKGHP
jgi:tetratricopeptide (TPR) repeat protein